MTKHEKHEEHEQQLRVIRHLLLSSPPGQFDLILSDIQTILSSSSSSGGGGGESSASAKLVLTSKFIEEVRNEYETRSCRFVLTNDTNDNVDKDDNNNDNPNVAELRKAMEQYIQTSYCTKSVRCAYTVTVSSSSASSEVITIRTYAERIDLRNCHAGSWTGQWDAQFFSSAKTDILLKGRVSITAHTFENNGNVQLHSDMEFPAKTLSIGRTKSSSSSPCQAVIKQIQLYEEDVILQKLQTLYKEMSTTMLKSLRRVMPVTRTKMEWNVHVHRTARTISSSSSSSSSSNKENKDQLLDK